MNSPVLLNDNDKLDQGPNDPGTSINHSGSPLTILPVIVGPMAEVVDVSSADEVLVGVLNEAVIEETDGVTELTDGLEEEVKDVVEEEVEETVEEEVKEELDEGVTEEVKEEATEVATEDEAEEEFDGKEDE